MELNAHTSITHSFQTLLEFVFALAATLMGVFMLAALWFIKVIFEIIQKTILFIFQAAPSPKTSPFAYAAALLNIVIVGAKLAIG
jgi:hypothetical protein